MDAYDCEQIDKAMIEKINVVFNNPTKHVFCSQFDTDVYEGRCGVRGGTIRGRKTICGHCGLKQKGHASVTEQV